MQWIDEFISRKHGKKKIEYIHPGMELALKSTYGVIVYQEQVMQISKELSGFSGGQADYLRKAIGKKIPEALAKLKTDFIEGAVKKSGADRDSMEKFWKQLEEFAAYCFNKAHAACYAMIAYWTAYLKANYPSAFMAALMTSDYNDTDRLAIEMNECRQMGIEVLPPDVNESFVGTGAVEEIIRAREKDGQFTSMEDFLKKINVGVVNKKALESLAKTGAMDKFGDRSVLVSNLETMVKYANKVQKERASGQTDLFGGSDGNSDMIPHLTLHEHIGYRRSR
jgi:DNA polymerase-3 subunit alpha